MLLLRAAFVSWLFSIGSAQAEWRYHHVPTSHPVVAIERFSADSLIAIGPRWHRLSANSKGLVPAQSPKRPVIPADALPDGRLTVGAETILRAWFAAPTSRYRHGVLGDAIEAGSLIVERRDGQRGAIVLESNAVFEDLIPRIISLNGRERLLVVKSYLDRGSALAIIDPDTFSILAETPPIGRPHAWLNPAGVADYDGDGTTDIAVVRQPHVLGRLELWSWRDKQLQKVTEVDDVSNHFIGSRALEMNWTADFDGDGHPDLAIPSLDRRTMRIIAFYPRVRDIARIPLPAKVVTNIGSTTIDGRIALLAGLENGQLIMIRND